MRRRIGFAFFLVVLGLAPIFGACGGAMAPMEAPGKAGAYPPAPEPEPQTVEEANAMLERARSALEQRGVPGVPAPTASGSTEPQVRPPGHVETMGAAQDECSNLCRAFTSMQRAQAVICRLAGDGDPRCADAKRVVEDNAKRVAHCGCH